MKAASNQIDLICLPLFIELVHPGIVGADMGPGKLPKPIGSGVDGWLEHALWSGPDGGRLSSMAMGLRGPREFKKNIVRVA